MIEELFSHKDYVRVLHAVKRKPKRFARFIIYGRKSGREGDLWPAGAQGQDRVAAD